MNSKNFTYLPCSIIQDRNLHVYGSHTRIKQKFYKNKTKQVYKSIFCIKLWNEKQSLIHFLYNIMELKTIN